MGVAALIGGTIFAAGAMADTTQGAYGPGYGMGRQQMFELSLDARNQIDAVLTKEQRDKRGRG